MIKKDNFGTRSNSKLAASGPIKAGTTNANLGGKSVVARANTPAQDPNLGRLVLTTIIQDIPKYSIDGEGNQVAINYTSLQIPKEKELRHPLVAGIQVSLVSGNFSQLITITSTLALNDTTISVASFNPNVDIGKGALICIDEEDLFNQYQNKTKGTIAGFTVDSDGIAKSGIEVTDWLNSDTMAGASVNNVPTALSVKNYVDNSHPAEDQTLQEVTDNGNTTTNSVMIGSSSSPSQLLHIDNPTGGSSILLEGAGGWYSQILFRTNPSAGQGWLLYDYSGNVMTFGVSNSERMRLTSAGRLGIGTSSPLSALHVKDGNVLSSAYNDASLIIEGFSKSVFQMASYNTGYCQIAFGDQNDGFDGGIFYHNGSRYMSFEAANAEKMRITSAGYLGIGTSSPSEKMSVNGNIAVPNGSSIKLGGAIGDTAIGKLYNVSGVLSLDGDGTRSIRFGSTTNGEVMRVDNTNQRIGIGTSSPDAALDVIGELFVGNGTYGVKLSYSNGNQTGIIDTFANHDLEFRMNNTEKMRITSAGRLGIGTSSPESLLTIKGDALTTSQPVRITNSAQDTHTALFINNLGGTIGEKYGLQFGGYNQYSIGGIFGVLDSTSGSTSGDITIDFANGTSAGDLIEKVRFTHEGNVGIGTSSPDAALDVIGELFVGNGTYGVKLSYSNGNQTGIIDTFANHDLEFRMNNTEKMRITSAGNVGIGTSSPSAKLEVQGNGAILDIDNDLSGTSYLRFLDNASSKFAFRHNTASTYLGIYDYNSSSDALIIKQGGNVGIGTTSPNRLLTLSASGGTYQAFNSTSNNNTTIGSDGTGAFVVYDDTASSYRMVVKESTGNVLIGTTTDSGAKATIAGQAALLGNGFYGLLNLSGTSALANYNTANKIVMHSNASADGLYTGGLHLTRRTFTQQGDYGSGIRGLSVGTVLQDNALELYTSTNTQKNETRLKITSTGNVLIGTTTDSGNKLEVNGVASATTFAGDLRGTINTLTTGVTQTANDNSTKIATTAYVDSAEAGTSSFGSFTPTSTQSIASGGNVGVKTTLLLATSQVTASNITTSSAGLTFANAGLYQISFNFASKVSGTANRTLAAANLEYSTDGESWTEIVGSLVYNYDRGTATSSGASSWGFVYDGSASCSFIHNLATSSIIRARFWIEGRASSASGITTIINGCRLSAHKIG